MKYAFFLFCAFTIISCDVKNPCDDIACFNGYCEDGNCFCDEGFIGSSCENEIPPMKVLIKDILVSEYPAFREDGTTWDTEQEGAKPDVRAGIRKGSVMLWTSAIWWADVDDLELEFGINPDLEITDISGNLELVLFDVEQSGVEDEEMISYSIQLYSQNGDGLYATAVSASNDFIDFTMFLDYEF